MRRRLLRLANRTNLHIGGDLSMTELMTVIFEYLMRVDPERPTWDGRDRFILSKGHGAGALYISMANRGFFDVEEIYATYGALGSRFGMHPCRNHLPGVETSTGSIGHGLSVAVGLALYFGLLRIPQRHLFKVTSLMILLLAAGLAAQAVNFLAQADIVSQLGGSVWDSSWLLDEGSLVGRVLHTLIGYTAQPTPLQLIAYGVTLLVIGGLMWAVRPSAPGHAQLKTG